MLGIGGPASFLLTAEKWSGHGLTSQCGSYAYVMALDQNCFVEAGFLSSATHKELLDYSLTICEVSFQIQNYS